MFYKVLSDQIFFNNIGWPLGGYKNILPEMLTILPESNPPKRAIQYYYNCYYLYRALCVTLLSYDRE